MLKKRLLISLTFLDGVLFRTKKFKPDYRYTKNFIDFWYIDELVLIDVSKQNLIDADVWAKVIWGDISNPKKLADDLERKFQIQLEKLYQTTLTKI